MLLENSKLIKNFNFILQFLYLAGNEMAYLVVVAGKLLAGPVDSLAADEDKSQVDSCVDDYAALVPDEAGSQVDGSLGFVGAEADNFDYVALVPDVAALPAHDYSAMVDEPDVVAGFVDDEAAFVLHEELAMFDEAGNFVVDEAALVLDEKMAGKFVADEAGVVADGLAYFVDDQDVPGSQGIVQNYVQESQAVAVESLGIECWVAQMEIDHKILDF